MAELLVSLVQTDLVWEDKEANLRHLQAQLHSLRGKTHVVVLPELFSTGFSMQTTKLAEPMEGPTVQWMRTLARELQLIITGSLMIEEGGNYYNRLLWVLPNGTIGQYDKRHLFAYAGEDRYYQQGAKRLIASVNGFKVNLQICYDLRFPVWARQQSQEGQPEYDLLLYVANWPERRRLAWMQLLQARAIENQCYVIGVNRVGEDGNQIYHSGDSMVIDPLGEILFTQKDKACIHTVTLRKEQLQQTRNQFPFLRDADGFELIV
jgi:omega-amidase